MSTPFREKNPVKIGAISLMVIALLLGMAFKADSLPVIGGGTTYYADFAEAGGLEVDDEVRVAGVKVGKVESVELDGDKVEVGFRITEPAEFGPETTAEIKVRTLLGAMYLDLVPEGAGQMASEATIPVERTTSPYDIVDAFTGLAETSEAIDSDQLGEALTTLADLTRNTPAQFRDALDGVSRLSQNLAAKDDRINELLVNLDRVTKVLDERDADLVTLMKQSSTLFDALVQRRDAIHNLLVSTKDLSKQLSSLIEASRKDLAPALDSLQTVLDVLNRNEEHLDETLRTMGPFYRVFANVLGNGPWFDVYIQNLPPLPQLVAK